ATRSGMPVGNPIYRLLSAGGLSRGLYPLERAGVAPSTCEADSVASAAQACLLDVTSLPLDELPHLVPPCVAPRWVTADRSLVHGGQNLSAPNPRRSPVLILPSLTTSALPVVQGRLFGMGPRNAYPWRHVLLPTLLAALRLRGDAPARSLLALAQRRGVAEADAATVVTPLAAEPKPGVA